ncbi:hypothetical protein TSOC_002424 [Tetrabaena socialis]|uniref:Uncharacterized protein n=1 Tax=Tetrabaena socialis TaxID=47790 RepID=A0A2J8AE49_9CHLO|nr:hypothetical protein TSOC_002424 [Tetrabaena socialis]|eukprot:PNH10787.1 hypothetical protein TSOC_002424 [Tetrabaena socialis]
MGDSEKRVVGFDTSPEECTLNTEAGVCKMQTQRSLLSELLALQALGDGDDSDSGEDTETEVEEDDHEVEAPVQDTSGLRSSEPVSIPWPCAGRSEDKAKDAYRRLVCARQVEQLHIQQQQQQLYQQQQQQLALQQRQRQHMLLQQQQLLQQRQGVQPTNQVAQGQHFGGQAHAH